MVHTHVCPTMIRQSALLLLYGQTLLHGPTALPRLSGPPLGLPLPPRVALEEPDVRRNQHRDTSQSSKHAREHLVRHTPMLVLGHLDVHPKRRQPHGAGQGGDRDRGEDDEGLVRMQTGPSIVEADAYEVLAVRLGKAVFASVQEGQEGDNMVAYVTHVD